MRDFFLDPVFDPMLTCLMDMMAVGSVSAFWPCAVSQSRWDPLSPFFSPGLPYDPQPVPLPGLWHLQLFNHVFTMRSCQFIIPPIITLNKQKKTKIPIRKCIISHGKKGKSYCGIISDSVISNPGPFCPSARSTASWLHPKTGPTRDLKIDVAIPGIPPRNNLTQKK